MAHAVHPEIPKLLETACIEDGHRIVVNNQTMHNLCTKDVDGLYEGNVGQIEKYFENGTSVLIKLTLNNVDPIAYERIPQMVAMRQLVWKNAYVCIMERAQCDLADYLYDCASPTVITKMRQWIFETMTAIIRANCSNTDFKCENVLVWNSDVPDAPIFRLCDLEGLACFAKNSSPDYIYSYTSTPLRLANAHPLTPGHQRYHTVFSTIALLITSTRYYKELDMEDGWIAELEIKAIGFADIKQFKRMRTKFTASDQPTYDKITRQQLQSCQTLATEWSTTYCERLLRCGYTHNYPAMLIDLLTMNTPEVSMDYNLVYINLCE